ncbi:MAG: ChrR family anti-sigma-E factor [Rhodovibrionaceae bacterium]
MTEKNAPDDVLLAYASGGLDEAMSLVVATHLTLSPQSRARVADFEALGGALIEEIAPAALDADSLDSVLARLDEEDSAQQAPEPPCDGHLLPAALRGYVGPDIEALRWKRLIRGVQEAEFAIGGSARARLMRIESGIAVPRHTHRGKEATLVLEGAYRDETGYYDRGALQWADATLDHQPAATGGETCLCLVVTEAPIRLTGKLGRLLNPLIKYQ